MRNAAAAVATADNWRNALREPLERISLAFVRPSSNAQIVSANLPALRRNKSGRRLTPHYSTESKEDLRASCNTDGPASVALYFWMAGNEKFDSEDRIDFLKRSALGS